MLAGSRGSGGLRGSCSRCFADAFSCLVDVRFQGGAGGVRSDHLGDFSGKVRGKTGMKTLSLFPAASAVNAGRTRFSSLVARSMRVRLVGVVQALPSVCLSEEGGFPPPPPLPPSALARSLRTHPFFPFSTDGSHPHPW